MLHSQRQGNHSTSSISTQSISNPDNHHGLSLLDLPAESLTHITSFLDPSSLLEISKVNRYLHQHIGDDTTWHRAFVYQLMGIAPESDLDTANSLMLRRSERSWRSEFITREGLKRRWQFSRNATTSHIPHHSVVSSMHLMPSYGLLTLSREYGIVSRSIPLTGRVLRGYLDASGTGLGIGNPNEEFTPNITACSIAADGGTAKIIWGFRNGEVAVMTSVKAMDPGGKAAAKLTRCKVEEQHEGAVIDVLWDDERGALIVTGGEDGRVKVWDSKKMKCLWASDRKERVLIPDACSKVAAVLSNGLVASAMRSGEIVVWSGFSVEGLLSEEVASIDEFWIPSLHDISPPEINSLYIDPSSSLPVLLITFEDDPYFHRLCVDISAGSVEHTKFGVESFGPISVLEPFFSTSDGDSSFIMTGDHLGSVSVYDWNAPTTSASVLPQHNFEAQEDGISITALAWNNVTLITGSASGIVKVFDSLTFSHLRTFNSLVPRARDQGAMSIVRQILVSPERKVLIVAAGDQVMAWEAGPVIAGKSGGIVRGRSSAVGGKKKKNKIATAKYYDQVELKRSINESRKMLAEEKKNAQRAYGREREHRAQLEGLGLNESEVVEYLLMISREEEEMRRRQADGSSSSATLLEEGVFEDDFEDNFQVRDPESASQHSLWPTSSPPPLVSPLGRSEVSQDQLEQSKSHSRSYDNIEQLNQDEPGPESSLPISIPVPMRASPSQAYFPPFGQSASTSPFQRGINMGGSSEGSGNSLKPGSAKSVRSAWGTSLTRPHASNPSGSWSLGSGESRNPTLNTAENGDERTEEMDDDLRFAMELSLAEARSSGLDV